MTEHIDEHRSYYYAHIVEGPPIRKPIHCSVCGAVEEFDIKGLPLTPNHDFSKHEATLRGDA